MAFDNSFTAVVGATYTAAQYNTHVRDNFTALWVYTTAGDIVYASSATALARLAKPSADGVLKNTSSGVPSWLAIAAFPGRLHTINSAYSDSLVSTTSTSMTDTGTSVTLTLTQTCTIVAFATGMHFMNNGTYQPFFGLMIDGTDDANPIKSHKSTARFPWSALHYRTGRTAGSRVIKLRYKMENASDQVNLVAVKIIAAAFVEG